MQTSALVEHKPDALDKALAAVALKQHGVIALGDVRAAGGSRHHAQLRVASGRWIKVHRGVYRLAGAPWTWHGQVMAAVKAAGPGAAASFFCAARLHGFGFMRAGVEISVPRGRFHRPEGVTVHTSTDLDRCEIVEVDGIPTTDVARSLLDVGGKLRHLRTFARTVEQARRLEAVTWHDLVVCLAKHARRGRRGIARLRELIEIGMGDDEVTDTDSELIAVSLLREHGFPEPALHHRVYARDGRLVAEMDVAYVDQKLDFEIDGSVHLDPAVKAKDDARDAELREVYGFTVRRIWWEIPVRNPREFIRIIRQYVDPTEPV